MAEDIAKKLGYKLKIFDAYRPVNVQKKLWDILPDANFIAPPEKGSPHSRGVAVDLTLVDENNNEEDKINNNFIGIIYECLIILQCTRLKNKFNCEDCEVFNKEVSIKLTGFENYDRLQINNITCD